MGLNPKQQEAVGHGDGPLLIAAGAGSGKTMTLTSRLAELIRRGVPPEAIVAITFTNKAAGEMRERISTMTMTNDHDRKNYSHSHRYSHGSPFIGTFHSFGARILRAEAEFFNRTRYFTIFDDEDSLRLVKKAVQEAGADRERYRAGVVSSRVGKIKNLLLEPAELLDQTELAIYETYERLLEKQNAFDFDDLIEKVVRLFRKNDSVLKHHQEQYRYVLVDEYQDVNPAQYEFIHLLAKQHKNLSVVGDDAQSIFGWRYADLRNFLDFERDWPDAKIVVLDQNYRSTPAILTAASAVIKNNIRQRPKELWTENKDSELIKVVAAEDEVEEAEWIASAILTMTNNNDHDAKPDESRRLAGHRHGHRHGENAAVLYRTNAPAPKERGSLNEVERQSPSIAILYRTNAQSRSLEQALLEAGIPYRIYGGVKFYERKEIKDIVAGLRYALNPRDELAAERIRKTFLKRTASELLAELPAWGQKNSALETINFFLAKGNYLAELEKNFINAEERKENINELIVFASEFPTLEAFVERVSLLQATDLPTKTANLKPQTSNRVNLMTIHMAKGLEFDNVFVAGCAEGLLPHQMSYRSRDELEEERRLMYVAMTRARKNLTLSFAELPSRFLYEIPPELTEFTSASGEKRELPDEDEIYID